MPFGDRRVGPIPARQLRRVRPPPVAIIFRFVPGTTEAGVSSAPAGCIAVKAPNLGTFYRAPKPGAASYVELGQSVTAEMEICLIEVMKLFTSVRAGTAGVIREICVDDAEMVEYGQTLFYIEPA